MSIKKFAPALLFLLLACICFSFAAGKVFEINDRIKIYWLGKWHVCTILETAKDKYKIRFEDDERIFDRWIPAEKAINFTYKKGDIILVNREGRWLPAGVLAVATTQYKIHYLSLESSSDEWVGPERVMDISFREGEKVQVMWNGDWFPAKILKYQDGKYLVHFDGFPDSYDSWTTIDCIRKIR